MTKQELIEELKRVFPNGPDHIPIKVTGSGDLCMIREVMSDDGPMIYIIGGLPGDIGNDSQKSMGDK